MNCQPCAVAGHDHPAVGLCPSCSAGLCLEHRIEQERYVAPNGTRYSCGHRLTTAGGQRRTTRLRALRAA
jgi:hypothetical protein